MDAADATTFVAQSEARRFRPLTDVEELRGYAVDLPYIEVARDAMGRLAARGRNCAGHDNEGRMPFVCGFLNERVLPMVDPRANVAGLYRIELHDSYSYRPRAHEYDNALTFARPKEARALMALMPDPFHMADYGGLLRDPSIVQETPWLHKKPRFLFAGSTTGSRNPSANARIRACLWSLDHRDIADFYVTSIVQMSPAAAAAAVPDLHRVLSSPLSLADQAAYNFQVNIAGNTACWSRVPQILSGGSLMVDVKLDNQPEGRDIMWYYPMLAPGTHYAAAASLQELPGLHKTLVKNAQDCVRMVQCANAFARDYFTSARAASYLAQLLEEAALLSRP
jgi:hypothetical protein